MRGAVVRRAVFVVHHEGEPLPSEDQQDALWDLFRVPNYVLQVDAGGRVCAYECEAREGLHTTTAADDAVQCGCGRPGLMTARRRHEDRQFALTAS